MNEKAWAEVAEARQNLQPTPPVGWPVQWYQEGDVRSPRAAQVTEVEDSGRIKVAIHSHGQMVVYKTGCYHVTSPIHSILNNPTTKRCGSWDYCPGMNIPKAHYEYHIDQLAKKEANLKRAEEQAIEQADRAAERREAAARAREEALISPGTAGEPVIAPKRKQTASA